MEILNPDGWDAPKGYANVVRVSAASAQVFIAGQVAWDAHKRLVGAGDFVAQFRKALENVVTCLRTAGGEPSDLVSLTIFVLDKRQYLAATRDLGVVWKQVVGRHWPAMTLVEVAGLLEEGALVEIQASACVV